MKIYIAGKVSGEQLHEATMKFGQAQYNIEQLGVEAINPLEVVHQYGLGWKTTWNDAMRLCIAAMMTADAVYLLPDWKESDGARIEKILAEDIHIPVLHDFGSVREFVNKKA